MVKAEDLRVKRTRKLITQAFFGLLRTKKFEKISIQEIADHAMINRATFYAHYSDKQDLYDSLIEDFLIDFTEMLDENSPIKGNNVHVVEIEEILTRFYDFVRKYPEVAQIVTDKAQDPAIIHRFLDILNARYAELFEKLEVREQDVIIPIDFVINYIVSILVGTLKWWVMDSKKCEQLILHI